MATAITITAQDITGDFDLAARATADGAGAAVVQKSLGSGSTNWLTLHKIQPGETVFVKNTGANAFKLESTVANTTVEFQQ